MIATWHGMGLSPAWQGRGIDRNVGGPVSLMMLLALSRTLAIELPSFDSRPLIRNMLRTSALLYASLPPVWRAPCRHATNN